MKRRATIQDIAEYLGVSKGTVSLALNDGPGVNQETKRRVKDYAQQIRYLPNQTARSMNTGRSYLVAVALARLDASFFEEVVQGIENVATLQGYDTIVTSVAGDTAQVQKKYAEELAGRLISRQIDGLIGSVFTLPDSALAMLDDADIPVLYLGADVVEGQSSIIVDNIAGGRLAIEHLKELGHQRILFLGGNDRYAHLRLSGAEEYLVAHEAHLEARILDGAPTMEAGYYAIATRLRSRRDFTAVFCANDHLAVGVCKALQDAGVRVPDEVSVVGFDDLRWTRLLSPSLTTIHQPQVSQGEAAMKMLLNRIAGGTIHSEILSPRLVVRESTGPAPA